MERSQRFDLSSLPDDINLYLEEKIKNIRPPRNF